MRIKLKNVRPLARRGKRAGDEDDLLAYLMNSNNTVYSPTGGYNVQFAPTAENRDYQAVGLPAAQIVGQSPNPQARYVNQLANQISQQRGVGNNNDYFRTVGILNNIMKDKKYVGKDGALNQQGWAKLAQDQMFGPGSDWYKRHSQSAKDVASGLAQVAMLPGAAAGLAGITTGRAIGTVVGGGLGSVFGSRLGKEVGDNPYTGSTAGSEIGGLVGGLAGGLYGNYMGNAYTPSMGRLNFADEAALAGHPEYSVWRNPSQAEISAAYPVGEGKNIPIEIKPTVSSNGKTSLKFYERPSKISTNERLGMSKQNRNIAKRHEPYVHDANWYNETAGTDSYLLQDIANSPYKGTSLAKSIVARPWRRSTGIKGINVKPSWYRRNGIVPESEREVSVIPEEAINEFANRDAALQTLEKYADVARDDYNNWLESELMEYNYGGTDTDAMLGLTKNADAALESTGNILQQMRNRYPFLNKIGDPYYLVNGGFGLRDDIYTHGLKYGGRVKRPFGGGIPEGVPFVEAPVAYSPQYNGLWAPTAPIRNASPIDIIGGRPVVRGPIASNIISTLGTPLDEFYKLNPNAKSRGIYIGDEFVVNKNRNQKKYGGAVRRRLESGGQLSY